MMSERPRTPRGVRPRSVSVALAAAGALLLGACGGDDGDAGSRPPSPPRTDATTTTDVTTATATASGTPSNPASSPRGAESESAGSAPASRPPASAPASAERSATTPRCTADHLALSVGRIDAGAGNRYAPLVFTNTGSTSCALRGYPGVSLLDTSNDRIGRPAQRSGSTLPPVKLAPGEHAYASLHTIARGLTDKPCWKRAERVHVYPPGSREALRAPARSFEVCGDTFDVSAVAPGKHP